MTETMNTTIKLTNSKDDSNNVEVQSLEELQKFIKFAGGEDKVYFWSPFNEWITVMEWNQSNPVEYIFE